MSEAETTPSASAGDPEPLAPAPPKLPFSRRALAWVAAGWSDVLFVLIATALLAWVASDAFSTRIVTLSPGADYWEHGATMRALMDHPWHPGNPHLVSPDSSPRYIPTFLLAALLARGLGLDALGAMGIASVEHTLLLLLSIFVFFRVTFGDRRASLYGLVFMFASWIDGWHFSNVYQLKIFFSVAGYPSTAGLGFSLLGLTQAQRVLRASGREYGGLALLALCWAALLVTHPLTAMLGFAGGGWLALTEPKVPWRRRLEVLGTLVLGIALSELWPYFSTFRVLVGGVHEEAPWLAGIHDESDEPSGATHPFYRWGGLLRSVGFALIGLPVLIYFALRRRYLFIVLGFVSMIVPFFVNRFLPLPLGHRFVLLAIFFLQAAVVWLLLALTRGAPEAFAFTRRRWGAALGAALVLALLLYTGVDNVAQAEQRFRQSERHLRGRDSLLVRLGREVADRAGTNAVVLADARTSWSLPTFGPKVVPLFHSNPLVHDQLRRADDAKRFFRSDSPDEWLAILRRYHVTHVLMRRSRHQSATERFIQARSRRQALTGGYVLYALNPI